MTVKSDIESLQAGQHVVFRHTSHQPSSPNVEHAFHRGGALAEQILIGARKACVEVLHGQQPKQNVVELFDRAQPDPPIETRYEFESRVKIYTPGNVVGRNPGESQRNDLTYIEASVLVRRLA